MSVAFLKLRRRMSSLSKARHLEKPAVERVSFLENLPAEIINQIAQFYVCPWSDPSSSAPSSWDHDSPSTANHPQPIRTAKQQPNDSSHTAQHAVLTSHIGSSPSGNTSPFVLCHISSKIRSIVQADPAAWSFLFIRNIHPKGVRLLRLWLRHLKNAPLHVDLYLDYAFMTPGETIRLAKEAVKMLLDRSKQWKSARIELYRILTFAPLFQALPTLDDSQRPAESNSGDEASCNPFPKLSSLQLLMKPSEMGVEPTSWLTIYGSLLSSPSLTHLYWDNRHPSQLPLLTPSSIPTAPYLGHRLSSIVELTLVRTIRGDQAHDILREAHNLKTFAPLGGLQMRMSLPGLPPPDDFQPHWAPPAGAWRPVVAGQYPNAFPTDRIIECKTLERLVLVSGMKAISRSRLPSFKAVFGFVKFPNLKVVDVWVRDGDLGVVTLDTSSEHPTSELLGRHGGQSEERVPDSPKSHQTTGRIRSASSSTSSPPPSPSPAASWISFNPQATSSTGSSSTSQPSDGPLMLENAWKILHDDLLEGNDFTLSQFTLTIPSGAVLDGIGEEYVSRLAASPRLSSSSAFSLRRWR